jgi:H+/gluconate symporter-like permease
MEILGLIVALGTLIFLALRGVNIILASLISSVIVALTNDLSVSKSLADYYAFGPLGAFNFMGRFFLLFLTGAMFGTLMAESHAAAAIAHSLANALGTRHSLLIIVLATALLTYGGVVVFVVIFVTYPLGLQLIKRARLPRRLLLAATALGSGTFTMTALPGTPSIHNVIASAALGTDLYAGAFLGILAALVMFGVGMLYLIREQKKLVDWEPPVGHYTQDSVDVGEEGLPAWWLAAIPMAVVLLTILLPKLLGAPEPGSSEPGFFDSVTVYALSQPVLWPSLALVLGCCVIFFVFPGVRQTFLDKLGTGANNAVMPLINTAVVVGFGGVVTQTPGFQKFAAFMPSVDLPPEISLALAINVIAGIVGSAAGGLQIFMQTLAPDYLAMGMEPETLHRIATVASGGIDSLPHCGAVIAFLTIMRVTHKEGYADLGMVTVVIPLLATASIVVAAMILS